MIFKYRHLTAYFLCLLLLMISVDAKKRQYDDNGASHQTKLSFYHEQNIPLNNYWITLEGDYSGQNYTDVMQKMTKELIQLKETLEQFNQSSPGTIKIVLNQKEEESFRQVSLKQSNYKLILSSLNIQFQFDYTLSTTLYIRIKNDKKLLGQIVDKLQYKILSFGEFKLSNIQKNTQNYKPFQKSTTANNKQLQQEEIFDQKHVQQKIYSKAEKYCQSLQMNLKQVQSITKVNPQQLENSTQQIEQSAFSQKPEQFNYYQAYQNTLLEKLNYQYGNTFYEVKALCVSTGQFNKLKWKSSTKYGKKGRESSNQQF